MPAMAENAIVPAVASSLDSIPSKAATINIKVDMT